MCAPGRVCEDGRQRDLVIAGLAADRTRIGQQGALADSVTQSLSEAAAAAAAAAADGPDGVAAALCSAVWWPAALVAALIAELDDCDVNMWCGAHLMHPETMSCSCCLCCLLLEPVLSYRQLMTDAAAGRLHCERPLHAQGRKCL